MIIISIMVALLCPYFFFNYVNLYTINMHVTYILVCIYKIYIIHNNIQPPEISLVPLELSVKFIIFLHII